MASALLSFVKMMSAAARTAPMSLPAQPLNNDTVTSLFIGCLQGFPDAQHGAAWILFELACPNGYGLPPLFAELRADSGITCFVAGKLGFPIFLVRVREMGLAVRAAVPEAPVDKDR